MPPKTTKKKRKRKKASQNGRTPKAPPYINPNLAALVRPIEGLVEDPRNARLHPQRNLDDIRRSLSAFHQQTPIVALRDGTVIKGNGTLRVALASGWEKIACITFDGTADDATAYGIADNRTGQSSEWDDEKLADLLAGIDGEIRISTGFNETEIGELLRGLGRLGGTEGGGKTGIDDVPDPPEEPITKRGDLWAMRDHRLLCGDATYGDEMARLLAESPADLICTDPPYCSGGFQESGRAAGSVGTRGNERVVNDRLSTRGYQALLKAAFATTGAPYLYVFTDWRMWVYLFDIVESEGYGVRSMIVWNKGTPGMGRGWRSQHELIMWACKETPPFDKHAACAGNVIDAKRTGNKHHATEKPVDLLAQLLVNTPFARRVIDPFTGSGTTLLACEQVGRIFLGLELDPGYVDVTCERFFQCTGEEPIRESDGAKWTSLK